MRSLSSTCRCLPDSQKWHDRSWLILSSVTKHIFTANRTECTNQLHRPQTLGVMVTTAASIPEDGECFRITIDSGGNRQQSHSTDFVFSVPCCFASMSTDCFSFVIVFCQRFITAISSGMLSYFAIQLKFSQFSQFLQSISECSYQYKLNPLNTIDGSFYLSVFHHNLQCCQGFQTRFQLLRILLDVINSRTCWDK